MTNFGLILKYLQDKNSWVTSESSDGDISLQWSFIGSELETQRDKQYQRKYHVLLSSFHLSGYTIQFHSQLCQDLWSISPNYFPN